ncbi:hypothetical protein ACXEHT_004870 [Klebsiella variicola]
MNMVAWIKHLFIHNSPEGKTMSTIKIAGNIQKAAITQLRSQEIAIYTGPTKEDVTAAATD